VAEALSICPQGGQAKVTRGQMETARTGPAAEVLYVFMAAFTRAGVIGNWNTRAPTAS
jgi:hypothetical protein